MPHPQLALGPESSCVKAFYSDRFVLPLPEGHRFPMAKYRLLRERVSAELPGVTLLEPDAASDAELAHAHTQDYIDRLAQGQLAAAEQRAIGFPWSQAMVERSRRSAGATLAACQAALDAGLGVNLAGGTHHAYADHGEGFCCFNDAAVAALVMLNRQHVRRVGIVDLDVHQGNGTAAILAGHPQVYTLSVHGERNYPFRKECSDLDIALQDGTGDLAYLDAVDDGLAHLLAAGRPDLIIYLAGADVHEDDRLGRLKLSFDGIAQRDERVFRWAEHHQIPVAVAMAGGYGRDLQATVAIHLTTVKLAWQSWQRRRHFD